ncbi:MAG: hypothetical protein V3V14_00220 [Saprospiraceae bacterium]
MKSFLFNSQVFSKKNLFLFLIFFAIIHGGAFSFADTYDHYTNVDVKTYVGLSNFDFDQHPVRRYRIIIPMLAAGVKYCLGSIFELMTPNSFSGDFPTISSFMLVNNSLMALFAFILFKTCQSFTGKSSLIAPFIGVLSVLTCRWTFLLSGTALVDSLFLVTISILILGILKRKWWLVIAAIYIGPWAKEAFIFFIPLLYFYDRNRWSKLIFHLMLSGIIVFAFRYLFDLYIGFTFEDSLSKDLAHIDMIPSSLKRLFSLHGLYEIMSIGGFWNLFIFIGFWNKSIRKVLLNNLNWFWITMIVVVTVQALLSNELARMFYLLTPLLAVMIAIVMKELLNKYYVKEQVNEKYI